MSESLKCGDVVVKPPFELTTTQKENWEWAVDPMRSLPADDWISLGLYTERGQKLDIIYRLATQLPSMAQTAGERRSAECGVRLAYDLARVWGFTDQEVNDAINGF